MGGACGAAVGGGAAPRRAELDVLPKGGGHSGGPEGVVHHRRGGSDAWSDGYARGGLHPWEASALVQPLHGHGGLRGGHQRGEGAGDGEEGGSEDVLPSLGAPGGSEVGELQDAPGAHPRTHRGEGGVGYDPKEEAWAPADPPPQGVRWIGAPAQRAAARGHHAPRGEEIFGLRLVPGARSERAPPVRRRNRFTTVIAMYTARNSGLFKNGREGSATPLSLSPAPLPP